MIDPKKPLVLTAHLTTASPSSDTVSALVDYFRMAEARVGQSAGGSIRADLGSRVALRMMGVLTKYGRQRLPMVINIVVVDTPLGSDVSMTMTSNEGYYLMGRMRIADAAYQNRFVEIQHELENHLS